MSRRLVYRVYCGEYSTVQNCAVYSMYVTYNVFVNSVSKVRGVLYGLVVQGRLA